MSEFTERCDYRMKAACARGVGAAAAFPFFHSPCTHYAGCRLEIHPGEIDTFSALDVDLINWIWYNYFM